MKYISVIIPAYNEGENLSKSVLSFIKQSIKPLEIIIVDDCSQDNTLDVANRLIQENSSFNIIVLKHNKNKGAAGARNTGLAKASGDIIVFVEGDGEYSKFYLKKILDIFDTNDNCFTGGGLRVCSNTNTTIWTEYWNALFEARWYISKKVKKQKGGWVFYKKDLQKLGSYNENMREGEDVELINRFLRNGLKSIWISNILFKHFEPEETKDIFKRFFKAGKNTLEYRKKEGKYYKHLIFSFFLVTCFPFFILSMPFLIYINEETRIAQLRLITKYKRGQTKLINIIVFPYQFYFQKLSTALGILIGVFQKRVLL